MLTARNLCLQLGYDAVTSKDISKAAKTNMAAVNYHFKSLEGLFSEVEKMGHIPSYAELKAKATRLNNLESMLDVMRSAPPTIESKAWVGYQAALDEIASYESCNYEY